MQALHWVCRYFDVEEKFVPLTENCFVMTPEKMVEAIDENTIGMLLDPQAAQSACGPLLPVPACLEHKPVLSSNGIITLLHRTLKPIFSVQVCAPFWAGEMLLTPHGLSCARNPADSSSIP